MLVVKTRVYNMRFWPLKAICCENVGIYALKDWEEIYKKCEKEGLSYQTGWASVKVPESITEPDKAIDYAVKVTSDFSTLLSFSQEHDVFFHVFQCIEDVDGKEKVLGTTVRSIRTGKSHGGYIIWPSSLESFLSTALPLIRDGEYTKKTGVLRAIHFFNEAQNLPVIELRTAMLFVGLELMANTLADGTDVTHILGKDAWKRVSDLIKTELDKAGVTGKRTRDRIFGSLGLIQKGPIQDKICRLLESVQLPPYEDEVKNMVSMRDDIVHGRPLQENYNGENSIDVMLKLERLLAKVILKHLRFYDHVGVHSAFTQQDLRARS